MTRVRCARGVTSVGHLLETTTTTTTTTACPWCTDVSNEVAHLQNQFFLLNHVTYLFSNGQDEPRYPGLAQVCGWCMQAGACLVRASRCVAGPHEQVCGWCMWTGVWLVHGSRCVVGAREQVCGWRTRADAWLVHASRCVFGARKQVRGRCVQAGVWLAHNGRCVVGAREQVEVATLGLSACVRCTCHNW